VAAPSATSGLDSIDLADHRLFRNGFPHRVFTLLRREAPVWLHPNTPGCDFVGGGEFWVISRHADIQAASRAPELFTADDGPTLMQNRASQAPMLTNMDGGTHIRQRKLISAGFTPRMTKRLEDQARGWAISIIDEALAKERCNFVHDVAYQLPMHMIADVVGIPIEDRKWLFDRLNDFLMCTDPTHPVPADQRDAIEREIYEYGQKLSDRKRRKPEDDVWSALTSLELAHAGKRSKLGDDELDGFFMLLNLAGSETTRNAISNGLLALLDDPGQLEALRADPSQMRSATEEIIRWSSPVSYFRRTVTQDTELGGVALAAGDRVSLWYPSGNRDSAVFANPFRFDITRKNNDHVAFGGGGPHFCLGAHLARREITILFEELLARVKSVELLGEPVHSVQGIASPIVVSLKDLPVALTN
jgi:cytochrome P450